MVDLVADGLLVIACLGMALYCAVLSRKISKLNQFETGLGGAIAAAKDFQNPGARPGGGALPIS